MESLHYKKLTQAFIRKPRRAQDGSDLFENKEVLVHMPCMSLRLSMRRPATSGYWSDEEENH